MQELNLTKVQHNIKRNDEPGSIPPNVKESCVFLSDGKPIGFYLREVPSEIKGLLHFADQELRSDRVPKSMMLRQQTLGRGEDGKYKYSTVEQYSCILGAVPAKMHMRRPMPNISSVHRVASASNFIAAMLVLVEKGEQIIKEITPEIYSNQLKTVQENVAPKFRLSNLFTSSISNCNISARYHQDKANLPCVNIIYTRRQNSTGGNLHIPDYDAAIDCVDGSMIVYPAFRNLHGVTPIVPTKKGGYRNSLVFYCLKGLNLNEA